MTIRQITIQVPEAILLLPVRRSFYLDYGSGGGDCTGSRADVWQDETQNDLTIPYLIIMGARMLL